MNSTIKKWPLTVWCSGKLKHKRRNRRKGLTFRARGNLVFAGMFLAVAPITASAAMVKPAVVATTPQHFDAITRRQVQFRLCLLAAILDAHKKHEAAKAAYAAEQQRRLLAKATAKAARIAAAKAKSRDEWIAMVKGRRAEIASLRAGNKLDDLSGCYFDGLPAEDYLAL